ncbi:Hypothetical predicted protein [Mytilus galloprovincialis]|uniref:Uncharacterized protein n=1 Tax=Mytilus galloprovincialis TaxID=29158 RepID=A0A8B6HF61_MYTGA|nr:Hypothetical predicted protein [Mytilus galloprovincialis]
MEHVMDKLNFLVDIAIDNKKLQHTQNDSILPKSANERSTTQQQMNSEEQDKKRCKLHWRIETPGYLEHKKDEIVKAMKNAIEIVKIGTSHEIEDIHEGSITIDTLLPMSILQDKNAFHQSIRKFLEEMVSVCGLDPNIPLSVKVQITLSDLEQGSVKYSIEEMKHTTMIDKAVQAVPTMLDRSTGSSELEIEEELDSTKGPEDDMMIYSASIKGNVLIPPSEMAFLQDEYGDFPTYEDEKYMLLMGCVNDIRWIESVLTFFKRVAPICNLGIKEKSKKLLNSKCINNFIHIASKSSQRSNNLKSMLQCLSESKDLQNNVITVVRDDVIISDLLKESKQIRVKINEKEWLPDLMDAIASSAVLVDIPSSSSSPEISTVFVSLGSRA